MAYPPTVPRQDFPAPGSGGGVSWPGEPSEPSEPSGGFGECARPRGCQGRSGASLGGGAKGSRGPSGGVPLSDFWTIVFAVLLILGSAWGYLLTPEPAVVRPHPMIVDQEYGRAGHCRYRC